MQKIKCNLCNNDRFKKLFRKNAYDIVKCKNCGLVTVKPFPEKKDLSELYEEEYFVKGTGKKGYSNYKKGIKDYIDYVTKSPFIKKRINYLSMFKKKGALLDIGCAHGFFLKAAEEKGWKVRGVDISKYAAEYGKKKLGLKITPESFEETEFAPNSFDAVTIWSFFDHVLDPTSLLKRVNRILKPGGIVAFNISNIDSYRAKINGADWRPFRPPEHLYYYSITTTNALLKKTGFRLPAYFGKREVKMTDIIRNPDSKLEGGKKTFSFSFPKWTCLYLQGLIYSICEKFNLGGLTVGSNLEVFAEKR